MIRSRGRHRRHLHGRDAVACGRSGSGPPLVLVHGTSGDRWSFRFVEPILSQRFTVYAVDRRGRGQSGDSENAYAIEQEFADLAAVVDALRDPVDVLGHSYGATVALGAAPLARNLRRLVLYEPAPGIAAVPRELLARLEDALARDQRDELLSIFMSDLGFDPEELAQFKASPVWAPRVAAAHTIPREIRAEESYVPDPDAFAGLSVPVLLLLGSESPAWAHAGTEVVQSLLPTSPVVPLEGQGHVATMTGPELLAEEVVRFLNP